MDGSVAAAAVLIVTYLLISMRGKRLKIGMGTAAAAGGAMLLLLGILPLSDVTEYINTDVLFLLLGMMMLAAGLEYSGFFQAVSERMARNSPSGARFLASVMIVTAILSAIALNDAVVLIFTPIVIKCCRSLKADPVPYIVGVMISANIGSLATSVGNPQNALIASEAGVSFITFSSFTLPISAVCLPAAFAMIYAMFRKRLRTECRGVPDAGVPEIDMFKLRMMITVSIGTFVCFALSDHTGVPVHITAMAAGIVSLMIMAKDSLRNTEWMAGRINWSVLVFFMGLFVIMGGVAESGLIAAISPFTGPGGETPSVFGLTMSSAILSNIVSNVPAAALLVGMLPSDSITLWIALAASSALAGNATIIGSAANVIAAECSERYGIKMNFWRFAAVGIPISAATILIAVFMISI